MTDKILTEAFDKLKAIEESEDPFCIGETGDKEFTETYTPIEEAGLAEAGDDYERLAQAINTELRSLGYAGSDLRNTKEAIGNDDGKRILQSIATIQKLMPEYLNAKLRHFGR